MDKSEFINNFSELLQNKDILQKLLSHNNCGIIQINTKSEDVSLMFFEKHHIFSNNQINYSLNDFYQILDSSSSSKLKEIIENFKNDGKIVESSFNLKILENGNFLIEFRVDLSFSENSKLKGVLTEEILKNPFFQNISEYNNFVKKVLSSSKIFLWKWDYKNKKQIFTKEYYDFLGYNPEEIELNYDKQRELTHPDDLESIEKKIKCIFRS